MKPMALAKWAAGSLGLALVSCTTASTAVIPECQADSVNERGQVLEPGTGARPVVLGYKDERQRQALLGLIYTADRVTVDPVNAALRVDATDGGQAREAFDRGLAQVQRNATLAGLAAHTRAVLLSPGEALMYEGLGDALRMARLEPRAEAAYRTGLDLEPSATLHVKLAEMLWMRAARGPAIEEALHAIAADSANERAITNLARWYYFTGSYSLAWEYVHRAEALGAPLPSQFRPLLAGRMPEPSSAPR